MSFNSTVLTIASVVFIFMLTITALIIKRNYETQVFPPEVAKCPDYWEASTSADGEDSCLYKGKNPPPDSSFPAGHIQTWEKTGSIITDRKKRCEWAEEKRVHWDGIWNPNYGC